jgi:pimeloyl-ACP methyl ester carboxylesterase
MTKDLIILHGWSLKLHPGWKRFRQLLENKGFRTHLFLIPGLLGEKLDKPWDLNDFAYWIKSKVKEEKINDHLVIGHSLGSSIALKYALLQPADLKGLVLINCSGIKVSSIKRKISTILTQIIKIFMIIFPVIYIKDFIYHRQNGLATTGYLKQTVKNCLNEIIIDQVSALKTPVLILWGKNDKDTPIEEGRILHNRIIQSKLVELDGSHGLPFHKTEAVIKEIVEFIKILD